MSQNEQLIFDDGIIRNYSLDIPDFVVYSLYQLR